MQTITTRHSSQALGLHAATPYFFKWVGAACLSALLVACGGGGGGDKKSSQSTASAALSSAGLSSLATSPSQSSLSKSSVSSVLVSSLSVGSQSTSSAPSDALYPDYNTAPQAPDATGMTSNATALAAKIALGWNIGNSLEAIGGETNWGNPKITPELLRLVKSSGFDAVRIPASWDQYADPKTAKISDVWLARVKEVVSMALAEDLYVLINIHWDGGWLEKNFAPTTAAAVRAKQVAYWQQIATTLGEFDERVIFASANEPDVKTADEMIVLDSYHQAFVDAVRATGGKNAYRVLVVQGPLTDFEKTVDMWRGMPSDSVADRLMMEVHFYTPFNFAIMTKDESWGKQFYYWGKDNYSTTSPERNPTWGEEATIDRLFNEVKTAFIDKGIPVILGEYSATYRAHLTGDDLALHQKSRAYYHEYVTTRAHEAGMVPFYWDNGVTGSMGSALFDRKTNTVFDALSMAGLRKAVGKDDQ